MGQRYVNLGVVATHMADASFLIRGGLVGCLTNEQRKANIRKAISNMRLARTQSGLYRPGDFVTARLP